MSYTELEIKILNVNETEIIKKLEEINAEYIESRVQKIYTYDCYSPKIMYQLMVSDFETTNNKNSIKKIINLIEQLNPVISSKDNKVFESVFGEKISTYLLKDSSQIDINKLKDKKVLKVFEELNKRFFKWGRLRQDNEKIELTIKYIYSVKEEYDINQVKEVEINVSDFETANIIMNELGYVKRKLVEKKRITYKLGNTNIELDTWPLINTYIEIEGENIEDIYDIANKLGYEKEDTVVMNTEDVYLKSGIDLTTYETMTFDIQEKE